MTSKNMKVSYECMELKEYKLSDFIQCCQAKIFF